MSEEIKSPYTRYATENDLEKILSHIKTYNNLDLIGLSNDDMSATDFLTNIKTINTALGDGDSILYLTTTNADNLHLSAIDKLNADTGKDDEGKFVAVCDETGVYSEDGVNWVNTIIPEYTQPAFLTYGNGKFVAISDQYYGSEVIYSEDGINWMEATIPHVGTTEWASITYGNGKFVAVSRAGGEYGAYSEDGINWTNMTTHIEWAGDHSITYGNGKFVAVCHSTSSYSEDGINWTPTQMPSNHRWYSVAYGNGKFLSGAYGTLDAYGASVVAYSEDGINWVEMTLPDSLPSENSIVITYCKNRFIAIARETPLAAYSYDGINWVEMTLPITCSSITYGKGKFVAIAGNFNSYTSNEIAYSEDGINWTLTTLPFSSYWSNIVYGGNIIEQYTSSPLSLKISRTGDIHNTVTIEAIYSADNKFKDIYSCNYYNDTISNFTNEEITTKKQIDKTLSSLTQSKTIFEPLPIQVATAEGQTQFTVNYDTFDAENDTLLVQSGITMLYPNVDFTVSGNTVTLTEGVPLGRTIGMYIMKIVQIPMSNNIISYGTVDLEPGVTPLAEGHIHFVYEQG